MADPLVLHENLKRFTIAAYRQLLGGRDEAVCDGVRVVGAEPSGTQFPARLLVVGDDGASETSITTADATIRLSVLAGSVQDPSDADDLVRIVFALAKALPFVDVPGERNPVAAVLEVNGPFEVPEAQERARRYGTVVVSVEGTAL